MFYMVFLINSLYFPVLTFQCLISVIQTVFVNLVCG